MNKLLSIVSLLLFVGCAVEVTDPEPVSAPCPAPTQAPPAPVVDAGAPDVEVYDPCNANFQRGRCDDLLLPSVWGFEKRCEEDGRTAYKSCASVNNDFKCGMRAGLRERCVEANGIVCCPE